MNTHDRLGDRLEIVACGDDAVDAVLDQLDRRVVGGGDDHGRDGVGRGLHDHHAVALALGGQEHAQRAAHVGVEQLAAGETGRGDERAGIVLGDRSAQRLALGAVAVEDAPKTLDPPRRARHGRNADGDALLRD